MKNKNEYILPSRYQRGAQLMMKTNAQDRDKSEMNIASRKKTKTVLNITLELSITYTTLHLDYVIHFNLMSICCIISYDPSKDTTLLSTMTVVS